MVKKVEPSFNRLNRPTYTIIYEAPDDGGYYKAVTKKGRKGEPDVEVRV